MLEVTYHPGRDGHERFPRPLLGCANLDSVRVNCFLHLEDFEGHTGTRALLPADLEDGAALHALAILIGLVVVVVSLRATHLVRQSVQLLLSQCGRNVWLLLSTLSCGRQIEIDGRLAITDCVRDAALCPGLRCRLQRGPQVSECVSIGDLLGRGDSCALKDATFRVFAHYRGVQVRFPSVSSVNVKLVGNRELRGQH